MPTAETTAASMGTKMPNLRNRSKGGFEHAGALDCESDILPLSYHAPYKQSNDIICVLLVAHLGLLCLLYCYYFAERDV